MKRFPLHVRSRRRKADGYRYPQTLCLRGALESDAPPMKEVNRL